MDYVILIQICVLPNMFFEFRILYFYITDQKIRTYKNHVYVDNYTTIDLILMIKQNYLVLEDLGDLYLLLF
ncbi:hypothetical protein pb186bvf_014869 [Paramecium bursaria]